MDRSPSRAGARVRWPLATLAALSLLPAPVEGQGRPSTVEVAPRPEATPPGEGAADTVTADPAAIGLPGALPPGAVAGDTSAEATPAAGPAPIGPAAGRLGEPAGHVGLAGVRAYDADAEEVVDVTAEARGGPVAYPTHWGYLEVDLRLPRRRGVPVDESPAPTEALEYALVPAHTGVVPGGAWVPLEGGTLRIAGLPYGRQELRVRSHPPGQPAVVDVPLELEVARPWFRHPLLYLAGVALAACAFLAYRRSWQLDFRRSDRRRGSRRLDARGHPPHRPADTTPTEGREPRWATGAPEVRLEPTLPPRAGASRAAVVDPPDAAQADEPAPAPAPAPTQVLEDATLTELRAVIEAHYADPEFSTERLAEGLAVSRRTLTRMTVPLTGLTPGKLIAERRLARARELLVAPDAPQVKAVAAAVGYRSADGFARAFRDRFGASPSAYGRHHADPRGGLGDAP